jgi:hypothetical protein
VTFPCNVNGRLTGCPWHSWLHFTLWLSLRTCVHGYGCEECCSVIHSGCIFAQFCSGASCPISKYPDQCWRSLLFNHKPFPWRSNSSLDSEFLEVSLAERNDNVIIDKVFKFYRLQGVRRPAASGRAQELLPRAPVSSLSSSGLPGGSRDRNSKPWTMTSLSDRFQPFFHTSRNDVIQQGSGRVLRIPPYLPLRFVGCSSRPVCFLKGARQEAGKRWCIADALARNASSREVNLGHCPGIK